MLDSLLYLCVIMADVSNKHALPGGLANCVLPGVLDALCDAAEGTQPQQAALRSSSSISAASSAVQQSAPQSHELDAEADLAAADTLMPELDSGSRDGSGFSPVDLQTPLSSSPVTEALAVVPARADVRVAHDDSNAAPAEGAQSSSIVDSADGVNCLDAFLHTVTTADAVLNDLLGELSDSSSLAPAELSRQSSASLHDLAQPEVISDSALYVNPSSSASLPEQAQQGSLVSTSLKDCGASGSSPFSGAAHDSSPLSALRDPFLSSTASLSAACALSPSSSPVPAADADRSSSAEPTRRSPTSPRTTTDVVLDTLLEDLRTAELARQSSSSMLLDSLASLAEMHRQSSSSPVPEPQDTPEGLSLHSPSLAEAAAASSSEGVSQQFPHASPSSVPRTTRQQSSFSSLLAGQELDSFINAAEPQQQQQQQQLTSLSCFAQQDSSGSAEAAVRQAAGQPQPADLQAQSSSPTAQPASITVMLSEEEEARTAAAASAEPKKEEEEEWVLQKEEEGWSLQRVETTDKVLEGWLNDARSSRPKVSTALCYSACMHLVHIFKP